MFWLKAFVLHEPALFSARSLASFLSRNMSSLDVRRANFHAARWRVMQKAANNSLLVDLTGKKFAPTSIDKSVVCQKEFDEDLNFMEEKIAKLDERMHQQEVGRTAQGYGDSEEARDHDGCVGGR